MLHLIDLRYLTNFLRSIVRSHNFVKFYKYYKKKYFLGKENKVDDAMALWTQMQEENTQPSDHFMWNLKELLENNNLEVPFTVQKPKEKMISSVPSDVKNSLHNQLKSSIENNDLDQALVLRKSIYSRSSSIQPIIESGLIELLTRENRLNEAFEIVKNMLENDKPITRNVLNFLVGKLSDAGNIACLEYLNGKIPKV
jgi:pentatricopeptide repeat protein